jgi:hypothetical protein
VKTIACVGALTLLCACSGTKKPDVPSLNEQLATELLHFDHKADAWLTYVKKQNPACGYRVDLPDQSSHPTEIDIDHLVSCGGRPAPKEFDATVTFVYDPTAQRWKVGRFAS